MRKIEDVIREIKKILLSYPSGKRLPGSRKLAEKLKVSPATVEKALAVLEEQGFIVRRERAGSFPAGSRIDLLKSAFFFPFSLDEYNARVVAGYISEVGLPPLVAYFGENFPTDVLLEELKSSVDFVFIVPPPADIKSFTELEKLLERLSPTYGSRIYLLDRCVGDSYRCIRFDDMEASRRVGKLLLEKGYRKFLFCYPVNHLYIPYQRLSGIVSVYREGNVPLDYRKIPGVPSLEEILSYRLIVSAEDYLTLKILNYVRENALRVPDDVKIVSFGGYRLVIEHLKEPVVGIVQPLEELGRVSAKIVKGELDIKEGEEYLIRFAGFENTEIL